MKLLLRNTQPLLGDRLMFTPVVRDIKAKHPDWRVGVVSAGPEIWLNNPHIDREINEMNADRVFDIGPAKVTKGSKTNGLHISNAFRVCLELPEKLGEPIAQGPHKPEVFLSDAEKKLKLIEGPYWLINIDTGPFSAKRWPAERFQQLVEWLPEITFVQVGLSKDNQHRLTGDNVIDMLDKTKIRELFTLVYHAEGCISLVSSLMHVAAAFDKPCVVVAGGREPPTFERYPWHRYIDNVGTMKCSRLQACWHNALSACENYEGDTARCMELITVPQVKAAVESYYEGGLLEPPKPHIETYRKRVLRIAANTKCLGGAERSVIELAKIFQGEGWYVELAPAGPVCGDIERALPDGVIVNRHLSRPCDLLLLYASDMVFSFDQNRFDAFGRLTADRKVMCLTYKIGKTGEVAWTKGWDRYMFLSSALRDSFIRKTQSLGLLTEYAICDTAVLAPPVDLAPFLAIEPQSQIENCRSPIRLARHSSQGDVKFPPDLGEIIRATPAVEYRFMPGPSGPDYNPGNCSYEPYNPDPKAVAAFLGKADCFWYLLPEGYTDQGPRVIVEAMAAGLPVIAENRDGAKDRVTNATGWLIDSHAEAIELINSLTPDILAEKGRAARVRAKTEFTAHRWYEEITDACAIPV